MPEVVDLYTQIKVSAGGNKLLVTKNNNGYDKKHRLVVGQSYEVSLVPVAEIESFCTTNDLLEYYLKEFGYMQPLAGVAPRVCEIASVEIMKEMSLKKIIVPHLSIPDDIVGGPNLFCILREGDGQWLHVTGGQPDLEWEDGDAFALLTSAA